MGVHPLELIYNTEDVSWHAEWINDLWLRKALQRRRRPGQRQLYLDRSDRLPSESSVKNLVWERGESCVFPLWTLCQAVQPGWKHAKHLAYSLGALWKDRQILRKGFSALNTPQTKQYQQSSFRTSTTGISLFRHLAPREILQGGCLKLVPIYYLPVLPRTLVRTIRACHPHGRAKAVVSLYDLNQACQLTRSSLDWWLPLAVRLPHLGPLPQSTRLAATPLYASGGSACWVKAMRRFVSPTGPPATRKARRSCNTAQKHTLQFRLQGVGKRCQQWYKTELCDVAVCSRLQKNKRTSSYSKARDLTAPVHRAVIQPRVTCCAPEEFSLWPD